MPEPRQERAVAYLAFPDDIAIRMPETRGWKRTAERPRGQDW